MLFHCLAKVLSCFMILLELGLWITCFLSLVKEAFQTIFETFTKKLLTAVVTATPFKKSGNIQIKKLHIKDCLKLLQLLVGQNLHSSHVCGILYSYVFTYSPVLKTTLNTLVKVIFFRKYWWPDIRIRSELEKSWIWASLV